MGFPCFSLSELAGFATEGGNALVMSSKIPIPLFCPRPVPFPSLLIRFSLLRMNPFMGFTLTLTLTLTLIPSNFSAYSSTQHKI